MTELEKEFEMERVSNNEWKETLTTTRRKLFIIFMSGAVLAAMLMFLGIYIYIKTGFRL